MPDKSPIETIPIVKAARVVTGAEIWVGLLLVLVGILPIFALIAVSVYEKFAPKDFMIYTLIGTFIFAVIETFAVILLWGLGRLELPEKFVHWLGGATIGEIATFLGVIVKSVFAK